MKQRSLTEPGWELGMAIQNRRDAATTPDGCSAGDISPRPNSVASLDVVGVTSGLQHSTNKGAPNQSPINAVYKRLQRSRVV